MELVKRLGGISGNASANPSPSLAADLARAGENSRTGQEPQAEPLTPTRRAGPPVKKRELTGFQKFLSAATFGTFTRGTNLQSDSEQSQGTQRVDGAVPRSRSQDYRENRGGRSAPSSAEVTRTRLYVGNLSYDATESDLFELFSGSGRVKDAEVVINSSTQRSKGFAFVTMMTVEEAMNAVEYLNNKPFLGRPLVVGGAKPSSPRD